MTKKKVEKTKQFLSEIIEFFKSIDEDIFELNKQSTIKDGEQEDLLHEFELGKLNAVEIQKTGKRMIKMRKERREIKDTIDVLKTIKPLADTYYKKGINAEIIQTITNLDNLLKTWNDRKYKPRVLKDLKCVEANDEYKQ